MKRGEPHPSLYEGVLGSPHSPFVLHASKGTGPGRDRVADVPNS